MAFKQKKFSGFKQNYSNADLGVTSKTASFSHKDYDDLNWRERTKLRKENKRKTKAGVMGYDKETTPRPGIMQRLKNLSKSDLDRKTYSK